LTAAPTRIKGSGRNLLARWLLRRAEARARAEAAQQVDSGVAETLRSPLATNHILVE
jgi:hypothetical protein